MSFRKIGKKRSTKKRPATKSAASRQSKRNTQKGRRLEEIVARMHGSNLNLYGCINLKHSNTHQIRAMSVKPHSVSSMADRALM